MKGKHIREEKQKRKVEWSKVFCTCIACVFGIYAIGCGIAYILLSKRAIEMNSMNMPDATLAVTCVSVVLGSLLSYLIYQLSLKTSLNKNKLTIDENGIVKSIMTGEPLEVINQMVDDNTEEDV